MKNLFVVSHKEFKLFSLDNLQITEIILDYYDQPGTLVQLQDDGSYKYIEQISHDLRIQLTDDPKVIDVINAILKEVLDSVPEGSTYYDVAWLIMPFNSFIGGFCNRSYEI